MDGINFFYQGSGIKILGKWGSGIKITARKLGSMGPGYTMLRPCHECMTKCAVGCSRFASSTRLERQINLAIISIKMMVRVVFTDYVCERRGYPALSAQFRSLRTGSSWIDKTVSMHPKAFPVIPKRCSSLVMRMSWSTVSNAAERSSKTNITHSPSSMARRMSLCIRVSAVSVLWPFLYADWKISCRLAS